MKGPSRGQSMGKGVEIVPFKMPVIMLMRKASGEQDARDLHQLHNNPQLSDK